MQTRVFSRTKQRLTHTVTMMALPADYAESEASVSSCSAMHRLCLRCLSFCVRGFGPTNGSRVRRDGPGLAFRTFACPHQAV